VVEAKLDLDPSFRFGHVNPINPAKRWLHHLHASARLVGTAMGFNNILLLNSLSFIRDFLVRIIALCVLSIRHDEVPCRCLDLPDSWRLHPCTFATNGGYY
jgi:hypothetical protein